MDEIINRIHQIGAEFERCKGLILSESDLKCLIYKELYADFSEQKATKDINGLTAISLHTELPWYDKFGKLTLRPDITILDASGLSLKKETAFCYQNGQIYHGKLPSKEYSYYGNAIIIEIKYYKGKNGITKAGKESIEKDIKKINDICGRNNGAKGVMVVFSKVNKGRILINELKNQFENEKVKIIFSTAGFELNNRN